LNPHVTEWSRLLGNKALPPPHVGHKLFAQPFRAQVRRTDRQGDGLKVGIGDDPVGKVVVQSTAEVFALGVW
tara:strand:+ start:1373 stop:1588 length:216 start_codon:yes stop_codon:yes gene_type:complete